MKELYGVGILFFYFLKWPFIFGLPLLYNIGLKQNIVLDILWLYCLILILKDFYIIYINKKQKKED